MTIDAARSSTTFDSSRATPTRECPGRWASTKRRLPRSRSGSDGIGSARAPRVTRGARGRSRERRRDGQSERPLHRRRRRCRDRVLLPGARIHEEMHPAPNFAMLSHGERRLVLSAPGGGPGGGQAMPDRSKPRPGGWNRFQLEVADLEATVARLRDHQAQVPQRDRQWRWGQPDPCRRSRGEPHRALRADDPGGEALRQSLTRAATLGLATGSRGRQAAPAQACSPFHRGESHGPDHSWTHSVHGPPTAAIRDEPAHGRAGDADRRRSPCRRSPGQEGRHLPRHLQGRRRSAQALVQGVAQREDGDQHLDH